MKELNMVKEALITSYKMIDLLESKIKSMTQEVSNLPWENKTTGEQGSYNTPQPTPAIESMATSLTIQNRHRTFGISKAALKRVFNENDKVVIWGNGVVTTLGESVSTKNPLAIFASRASAKIQLRRVGFIVPEANKSGGYPRLKYIIASKSI